MDGEVDSETEFSINFPVKFDSSLKYDGKEAQRSFAVIGETVDAILIAKFKGDVEKDGSLSRWKCRVENMATSVSVSACDRSDDLEKLLTERPTNVRRESICKPFASYKRHCKKKRRRWQVIDAQARTLACPLVAALDGLPTRCRLCDVHVAVWSPHVLHSPSTGNHLPPSSSRHESRLRAGLEPENDLNDDDDEDDEDEDERDMDQGCRYRQIVSCPLKVLSPPEVRCRHVSVAGNHHILLTVQNLYTEDLWVENIRVLPNANDGFLPSLYHPILGPLAALAADSTSEESDDSSAADVDGNSFIKVDTPWSGDPPLQLRPHESHTFPSSLSVIDSADLNESQEMHLFAVLTWRKVTEATQGQQVITHYRLPSVTVRKPGLVITAVPDDNAEPGKSFTVNYTITNNLQDFLSLKLVWNPEKALCDPIVNQNADLKNAVENVLQSVVCHQPSCHLGSCKQGSTVTIPIAFQVLNDGVFELGQHLKLKLQYSVTSVVPPNSGHQRRGSITSTHSLPVDPRPRPVPVTPHRSASMCPLAAEDVVAAAVAASPLGARRGSVASAKSVASAPTPNIPTPTDCSPVHTGKTGSYGNLLDYHQQQHQQQQQQQHQQQLYQHYHHYHQRGSVQSRVHTAPSSATMSPSNRSPVQIASPASGRPCPISSGVITPQQVLKRNCQVYVTTAS